ncbi:MAG TPA: hypothetical protein V6C91_06250 [Coleofasciculaceae cyanobacterium]
MVEFKGAYEAVIAIKTYQLLLGHKHGEASAYGTRKKPLDQPITER